MKTVFVASSRKYYDQVKSLKTKLDANKVKGFYPYFEYTDDAFESNPEEKGRVTLKHFPELDQIDVLYIVATKGYAGISVTIETTYAYAKGKEIISSEPIQELAVRALVSKVMTPEDFVNYVSS